MSVTTTSNILAPTSIRRVLKDYELHHAETAENRSEETNRRLDVEAATPLRNPANWPTQYRDVPPRKPINRNLDMQSRPAGANLIEKIFIFTLLNGVGINANINSIWRSTGGKINNRIFRYQIGGEW